LKFDQYIYIWTEKGKDKRQQTRSNEWIFKLPQVVTFGGGLEEEKKETKEGKASVALLFHPKFLSKTKTKKKPKKTKGVPK
jgi:hypothetical protein